MLHPTGVPGIPVVRSPPADARRRGFDPWVRKMALEEDMATHSSIHAGRIPWTEEPGGLQSVRD